MPPWFRHRLIDKAAALFAEIGTPLGMCEQVTTAAGAAYFSQRPGWDSDISWVSVDDRPTYEGVMIICSVRMSHAYTALPACIATYTNSLTYQPSLASSTACSGRGSTACSTARCASTAPSMCAQRSLKYGWPQAATLMGSPYGLPV